MNSRDRLKQLSSVYRLYVSSVASQLKQNGACNEWLRQATQNETAKAHIEGPTLLNAIAETASRNSATKNTIASVITSMYYVQYHTYATMSMKMLNGYVKLDRAFHQFERWVSFVRCTREQGNNLIHFPSSPNDKICR